MTYGAVRLAQDRRRHGKAASNRAVAWCLMHRRHGVSDRQRLGRWKGNLFVGAA
jgi:hypothetical protein